jgi:hypothetical protein
MKQTCIPALLSAGISWDDAHALRRISMTLHRWHELECGDSNIHGSWAIVRGAKTKDGFVHNDDGKPFMESHHYLHGKGKDYTTHSPLADGERGALNRLNAILARYPGFMSYVQTDPRGCSLYILRPNDIPDGAKLDECYSRGIAVYK